MSQLKHVTTSSISNNATIPAKQIAIGLVGLLPSLSLNAKSMSFNLTEGVTDISQQVYDLHMTIFIICCVIGLVVFAAMFWAIFNHRKDKGAQAAQFHENTKVEIIWTAIPFVILIGMASHWFALVLMH